jgi:hypothetical protein
MKPFAGRLLTSRVSLDAAGDPVAWIALAIHKGGRSAALAVPTYSCRPVTEGGRNGD